MRKGREGQDPSKNEWLSIGALQRWREGLLTGIRRNRGSHMTGVRARSPDRIEQGVRITHEAAG